MAAPWEEYAAAAKPWEEYGAAKVEPEKSLPKKAAGIAGDLLAGAVRGAGSIGATLTDVARSIGDNVLQATPQAMRPNVTAGLASAPRGEALRQAMDGGLQAMGADPTSLAFKGGKLGAEVAGTLGVGGAMAAPLRAGGPLAQTMATALETGGFRAPGLSGASGLLARMGAGGAVGGVSAGLVDPNAAGAGAVIGGVLPPVVQLAGKAGQAVSNAMQGGANRLMQSAVKPTLAQLRSGDAAVATQVMLDNGINPTRAGVEKLQALIDDTDSAISGAIAGSNAQIDKQAVLNALNGTRGTFMQQAAPQGDLAAIKAVEDSFLAHPVYSGPQIPVADAQALKQGTYRVLKGKYGEAGSAATEAQKAIARGLKEEIAAAVPAVKDLNAQQSQYLRALGVVERRALMESNKNPLGLSALAPTPGNLAMFMADRSAILKALAARGVNAAAKPVGSGIGLLDNPALLPYVRGGLLATEANP